MVTSDHVPLRNMELTERTKGSEGNHPMVTVKAYFLATDGSVPESIDVTWQAANYLNLGPDSIAQVVTALADVAGRREQAATRVTPTDLRTPVDLRTLSGEQIPQRPLFD
jgi:hypothetical protein